MRMGRSRYDLMPCLLRGRALRNGTEGERSRLKAALERLELYYGDIDAHAQAFRAALSLDASESAAHHQSALRALEARIAASGDGTPEAPYAVLTAQDAFDWLRQRKIATVGALYQGTQIRDDDKKQEKQEEERLRKHAYPGDPHISDDRVDKPA